MRVYRGASFPARPRPADDPRERGLLPTRRPGQPAAARRFTHAAVTFDPELLDRHAFPVGIDSRPRRSPPVRCRHRNAVPGRTNRYRPRRLHRPQPPQSTSPNRTIAVSAAAAQACGWLPSAPLAEASRALPSLTRGNDRPLRTRVQSSPSELVPREDLSRRIQTVQKRAAGTDGDQRVQLGPHADVRPNPLR
jgi:hypothetical protein